MGRSPPQILGGFFSSLSRPLSLRPCFPSLISSYLFISYLAYLILSFLIETHALSSLRPTKPKQAHSQPHPVLAHPTKCDCPFESSVRGHSIAAHYRTRSAAVIIS